MNTSKTYEKEGQKFWEIIIGDFVMTVGKDVTEMDYYGEDDCYTEIIPTQMLQHHINEILNQ